MVIAYEQVTVLPDAVYVCGHLRSSSCSSAELAAKKKLYGIKQASMLNHDMASIAYAVNLPVCCC